MFEHVNIVDNFYHKFFFPSTLDIIIYNLSVFARVIIVIISLGLVVTALAGFLLYIAYYKSREVNDCRLLNSLTGILALTYIITAVTSFSTILREINFNYGTYGPQWRLIRIYTGSNTVMVFAELTLASLLSMYSPTAYLTISLSWRSLWTLSLNLILIFVFHIISMGACDPLGDWTGDCVVRRLMASGIYFVIPIMICQLVIFVDCKWGWRKIGRRIVSSNSVLPLHTGTNETDSELDTTKIKTGFASLMADTGMRVVAYIIWKTFGFQETIVMRNLIKLASLASVAVFWIVRDDKLGAFARIMIKKFPQSLPCQN